MSIRSLDMQVLVQKASDVAKVQHNQHQEIISRQDEFAQNIIRQTTQNSKTVQNTNKSEKGLIQEKPNQDKRKNQAKKRGPTSEQKDNKLNPNNTGCDNKIDILI